MQTLTQEEKPNVNIIKRKEMSGKQTIFPSLRNQDWRTVKSETEKVKDLLANIPTKDITDLNDLIYTGGKYSVKKIGSLRRPQAESQNPGWN